MSSGYWLSRWSALLLTITILAGCGVANVPVTPSAAQPSATTDQSTARMIQHAMGTSEVPANPQRVVVLDTGELDTALALGVKPVGAVEAIAGEGYQAYFGDLTEGITNVGTIAEPNLETIATLNPDLILSNKVRHEEIYEQLEQIAPTVFAEQVGVVWKDNFKLHADALGKAAEAEQMMQQYDQRVATLKSQLGDPAATEVSIVRFLPEQVRLYQRGSFIGTIFDDLGFARPASQQATDETWLEGNKERIGDLDGDMLFVTYYGDETAAAVDEFKADPLWSQLDAVQNNNVYDVSDDHWMLGIGMLAANKVLDDLETLVGGGSTVAGGLQVIETTGEHRIVKHGLGETQVPLRPQRIVALQDQNMLLPLLELGASGIVGSAGYTPESGEHIFRRTAGYDTSQIQYVGEYGEPNLEAIAALQPDLILGGQFDIDEENYDLLSQIAPTVQIQIFTRPVWDVMNDLALLTNTQDAAAELKARYDDRIAEVKTGLGDPSAITLSIITPYNTEFYFDASAYDNGVVVARDLGMNIPALHEQAIEQGDYPNYSMELLKEADADALFILDYGAEGETTEYSVDNIRNSPLFSTLNAVQKDQAFVIDPTRMGGVSYGGLFGMIDAVEEHLAGKPLDTTWEPQP